MFVMSCDFTFASYSQLMSCLGWKNPKQTADIFKIKTNSWLFEWLLHAFGHTHPLMINEMSFTISISLLQVTVSWWASLLLSFKSKQTADVFPNQNKQLTESLLWLYPNSCIWTHTSSYDKWDVIHHCNNVKPCWVKWELQRKNEVSGKTGNMFYILQPLAIVIKHTHVLKIWQIKRCVHIFSI